jgi:hypothetical protein
VKAAPNGFHSQLRVALSDGLPPSRFSAFLALCCEEGAEVEIRLSEILLTQQIKGLHDDLYEVGFLDRMADCERGPQVTAAELFRQGHVELPVLGS